MTTAEMPYSDRGEDLGDRLKLDARPLPGTNAASGAIDETENANVGLVELVHLFAQTPLPDDGCH
jgi:hypothetical protein